VIHSRRIRINLSWSWVYHDLMNRWCSGQNTNGWHGQYTRFNFRPTVTNYYTQTVILQQYGIYEWSVDTDKTYFLVHKQFSWMALANRRRYWWWTTSALLLSAHLPRRSSRDSSRSQVSHGRSRSLLTLLSPPVFAVIYFCTTDECPLGCGRCLVGPDRLSYD
jgi:hypothetical protein